MTSPFLALHLTAGTLPPADRVVLATQRLRGAVIASAVRHLRPDLERPQYADLGADDRELIAGLTGKDADGNPTVGNRHLALFCLSDAAGQRVLAYKAGGIDGLERIAILGATRRAVRWGMEDTETFRLVPVPGADEDAAPLVGPALRWVSHTPFVPPPHRHRYRKNGKARDGETPERQISILCNKMGHPAPVAVDIAEVSTPALLHRTWEQREAPPEQRGASRWPGYRVTLTFAEPTSGPIFLGHSCHFGLGLFVADTVANGAQSEADHVI